MGYQITAPPGITINEIAYEDSQLQNIANGRGWKRHCARASERAPWPTSFLRLARVHRDLIELDLARP